MNNNFKITKKNRSTLINKYYLYRTRIKLKMNKKI